MKRRTYLRAVGGVSVGGLAALAGCTGSDSGDGGDGGDDTTTSTDDPSFPTRVAAVEPDPVTDALDASVSVSLANNFSGSTPAELTVEVTNDTGTAQTYQFGPVVPWSSIWARHGSRDATLVAVPGPVEETQGGDIVPSSPSDGCWQATDGIALAEYLQTKEVSPGESLAHRYTLIGQHDDATCLPAGRYRFADSNYLGRADWGFDVRIERG